MTPYFTVDDADFLIRFVTEVFEGRIVKDDRYADGRV